jgi:hypothetical protein
MRNDNRTTNQSTERRIPNAVQALLGLGLAASPWIFGFSAETGALWTAIAIGVAALAVGGYGTYDPREWQAWTLAGLGVVAVIAPWIFGFAGVASAMWTLFAFGLAHLLIAGAQLWLWRWRSPEPQTA